MRGSVVLAGAILGAISFIGAPAPAVAAAPDPYSPSIDTECNIQVPAVVEPGKRVRIRISVSANSPTPPKGKVDLAIKTGGDVVWDKTVNYNGGTKTVVGPVLDEGKSYTVTSRFRPSDSAFARCSASAEFAVDDTGGGNPDGPDDNGPGGLLPDTGGPALLWLMLGVGLVGGGSATVVYARRRTSPAPA